MQLYCGKSVKYRFIKFFLFDYGSLPYLLSLLFFSGVTFPLVALDKKFAGPGNDGGVITHPIALKFRQHRYLPTIKLRTV